MKLLKYLQKTKWITRDDFEQMLKEKVIKINWNIVDSFSFEIKKWDRLEVNLPDWQIYEEVIEKLPNFRPVIVLFNKPKWYVVSKADPYNKTIFELLPQSWRKDFYYIWRLDKNSRGLLLLTNDPEIVDRFTNPKNKVIKVYEVQIDRPFKSSDVVKVKKWIYVDQQWKLLSSKMLEKMKSMSVQQKEDFLKKQFIWRIDLLSFKDVKYFKSNKGKHFLRVVLTEGKKRHIRRVLKALWYKVLDLKRIKFWKYELWNLKEWKYRIMKIF